MGKVSEWIALKELSYNKSMKRRKPKLPKNSLEARNMVRHTMPLPTVRFRDKKKAARKSACRER
jgi:hypothetical protein